MDTLFEGHHQSQLESDLWCICDADVAVLVACAGIAALLHAIFNALAHLKEVCPCPWQGARKATSRQVHALDLHVRHTAFKNVCDYSKNAKHKQILSSNAS